jgi:hypothetical protein
MSAEQETTMESALETEKPEQPTKTSQTGPDSKEDNASSRARERQERFKALQARAVSLVVSILSPQITDSSTEIRDRA